MSKTDNEMAKSAADAGKQEAPEESTVPGKRYVPAVDIVETEKALQLRVDMPGVAKERVNVRLDKDILQIDGQIDSSPYLEARPVYTEYNVGHYSRRFSLGSKIDRDAISAEMAAGVLTLTLPKLADAAPRQVKIA